MNFACWTTNAWAAGTWVEGSWCPGATPTPPSSEGTGMRGTYYRQNPTERLHWLEEEEIIVL